MLNIKSPAQILEKSEEHLPENRKAMRLIHKGTIMVSDGSLEYYSYAQVCNVSGDGMYFESDQVIEQGKRIGIRFDNPPFKTAPNNYSATVQWCKPLSPKESILPFGVGVKFR
jgi:hypothetical protein